MKNCNDILTFNFKSKLPLLNVSFRYLYFKVNLWKCNILHFFPPSCSQFFIHISEVPALGGCELVRIIIYLFSTRCSEPFTNILLISNWLNSRVAKYITERPTDSRDWQCIPMNVCSKINSIVCCRAYSRFNMDRIRGCSALFFVWVTGTDIHP